MGTRFTFWGAIILLGATTAHAGTFWFVDDDGDTENGCTSWADACPELQTALSLAGAGDQIWVAQGAYKPDFDVRTGKHTADREATFQLINGVEMYGGFDGTESSLEDRADLFDQTVLTGDLNGDDDPDDFPGGVTFADNSCHVMMASNVNDLAIFDGFTITGGNADTSSCTDGSGAGLLNDGGSPKLANCTFAFNSSIFMISNVTNSGGAGMWNSGHPILTDCTFIGNSLILEDPSSTNNSGGGAIWNSGNATLTNCVLSGNELFFNTSGGFFPNTGGGGMWNSGDPVLNACAFNQNAVTASSFSFGGGMWNSGEPTLTDCTFQGNSVSGVHASGGGMYQANGSSQQIRCTFRQNSARHGGGIYLRGGNLELRDCTFDDNDTQRAGGGLWQFPDTMMTLTDCTFRNNSAGDTSGDGGGIATAGNFLLSNCTFIENSAITRGGGILLGGDTEGSRLITDCAFRNNSANDGGGVYIFDSSPTLDRCIFVDNLAPDTPGHGAGDGGGLFVGGVGNIPTVTNCLFTGNSADGTFSRGGGIFVADVPGIVLTNCTLYGNWSDGDGGGIFSWLSPDSVVPPTFTNCILWANGAGEDGPEIFGPADVRYSNVQGGWAGAGNIDVDPLFVDPAGLDGDVGTEDDNLRLSSGSPCIDAADNSSVPEDVETDLDGNLRIIDGDDDGLPVVDMGAYEYQACSSDFNNDGTVDASDLAELLGDWGLCAEPCEPADPTATCAADLSGDCEVEAFDLAILLGSWGPCLGDR